MAGFLKTIMATTTTTTNSTIRVPEGNAVAVREVTPNGVIATRRKVTSDDISAKMATPAKVITSASGPTHSCSKVNRCAWKGISMTAGIRAQ